MRQPIDPLHYDTLGDYEIVTAQVGAQLVTLVMARISVRVADSPDQALANHQDAVREAVTATMRAAT